MVLENDLGKDDIKKLVLRLAIPAMIAQFVNILYNIVDRIYVANIPVIGEMALAALGVCAPIITLIGSFSSLVGIGGATLVSMALGEKNKKRARDIISNALIMLTAISIVLMVVVLLFKAPLLHKFGASNATFQYANEYVTVYILGTIFSILGTGLNLFVTAQGYAKKAMASVMIGAISNIILDPIFIFKFGMGVGGAALATIISQFFAFLYVVRFLLRKDIQVSLNLQSVDKKLMGEILKIGINPFIIVATDNVILIAMNMALQKHGGAARGDLLLASSAILQSFMLMISMPLLGITTGTQPILGYNFGAKNSKRVIEAEKFTLLLALIFTTIMFILAQTIPHMFTRIFTTNPQYIETASRAIRMYTLGIIPMAIQYTAVDSFTGIGSIKISITLSLFRKSIFLLCVLLIPQFFDIMNIFYTESISDIIGGITSGIVFAKFMPIILREREFFGTPTE